MKLRSALILLLCITSLLAQAQNKKHRKPQPPIPLFDSMSHPPAPDYALAQNWAALPDHQDAADLVPKGMAVVPDSAKQVDVFYIHPTTYNRGSTWNADVNDAAQNAIVDKRPVKYQATAWNETGRIYAPRYRQALLRSFFGADQKSGKEALDLAYEDVKRAFEYYLAHYNNGRPIIIASHSQGSYHARRLLKEFFDKGPLRNKLVCAYVVGFPVFEKEYTNLRQCNDETQTGCIVSWASYRDGFEPMGMDKFYGDAICTNPVTWKNDSTCSIINDHKGMVLFNFNKVLHPQSTVRIHKNILWVKVNNPLAGKYDNLHIADINLFWMNIREDVKKRVGYYWKQ